VIKLDHEGHPGIVRAKNLLRERVWFPKMNEQIEKEVEKCLPCQATTDGTTYEPIGESDTPTDAWQKTSLDFYGPFKGSTYFGVLICKFSKYPVKFEINSTSFKKVKPELEMIFFRFGVPDEIKTDNGPPFNGAEFSDFAKYHCFKHRKITPAWPAANGHVEVFNKMITKTITRADIEGIPWREEVAIEPPLMRRVNLRPRS
jgi:hypothetical protein